MIPRRFEPQLFALVLSSLMSLIVVGISTVRMTGLVAAFPELWLKGWLTAWPVAFPTVLLVAPLARRIVHRMIRTEEGESAV